MQKLSATILCTLLIAATACASSEPSQRGGAIASEPTAEPTAALLPTPEPTATEAPAPTPEPTATEVASVARECLPAGLTDATLELADGSVREYRMLLPERRSVEELVPLVLDFHGATASALMQTRVSNFESLAELEGFAVITATGLDQRWSTSDVAFVDQLLDEVVTPGCVDPERVFAAGMSNGGFFSAQLACDLSERIAAIGTVTGIRHPEGCSPSRPVPIIHFHGTADEIVAFDRIPSEVDEWVAAFGCTSEPTISAVTALIELRTFRSCDDDVAIDFYVIEGAGHTWPGSAETLQFEAVLGPTNTEIDATELIWQWFQQHPLAD